MDRSRKFKMLRKAICKIHHAPFREKYLSRTGTPQQLSAWEYFGRPGTGTIANFTDRKNFVSLSPVPSWLSYYVLCESGENRFRLAWSYAVIQVSSGTHESSGTAEDFCIMTADYVILHVFIDCDISKVS